MNLAMNKDFQGAGRPTLTGRMHLEAHLRSKYLHKNALLSLTVRAKAGARKQKWVATQILVTRPFTLGRETISISFKICHSH